MAKLSDVARAVRAVGPWGMLKRIYHQLAEDNVYTWGAALAYSWLFAIFPFLIFLLSLVPLLPERFKPNVREDVSHVVDRSLPADAASVLNKQIASVLEKPSAGGFLSFGLILTIWAASGGMAMTMYALDKAYDIEKGRSYLKRRVRAIGLTIVVATLVIAVLILMPIGTSVLKWLGRQGNLGGLTLFLIDLARYSLSLCLLLLVLALIYHFGPSFKQKFHIVTPGSIFCVAVWILLAIAFRVYLTKFGGAENYNRTYGAVAGAILLLLFFYVDAVVLLVGAEINSEIDFATLGVAAGSTRTIDGKIHAPLDQEKLALLRELQDRGSVSITPPKA
jgi:membrane protein